MSYEDVRLKLGKSTTRNANRVPVKQWKKWPPVAQRVFNDTYTTMMNSPDVFTHPQQPKFKPFHWKTLAWNAAWIAADHAQNALKETA